MDIYQIWTTYNPMWSARQFACFTVVLILVAAVVLDGIRKRKLGWMQGAAIAALAVFLGVVFGSTVFTRPVTICRYELQPLWSWYEVIWHHDRGLLKENLLNCLMLGPMGLLLPVICARRVRSDRAFIAGFLVSAVIEMSQLIFRRGLFEWDDMIHNALGCMLGCWVMNCIIRILGQYNLKRNN